MTKKKTLCKLTYIDIYEFFSTKLYCETTNKQTKSQIYFERWFSHTFHL